MHLLVVSPDFPPLGSPQAYQSVRLVKALSYAGFAVTVISGAFSGERKDFQHLSEVYEDLPTSVKVIQYDGNQFPDFSLLRRAYRYLMPSDTNYQYLALKRCLDHCASRVKFDGIISIAEPLVTHLAVQRTQFLKSNRFRCFWFSDPVPMASDVESMKFKWRRKRCEAICKTALRTGNCIVGVTSEIVEPILRLTSYPSAEPLVLPHVYDPTDWPTTSNGKSLVNDVRKTIRVVHSGALYWKRTPFSLIEGARLLKQDSRDLDIELILQGGISSEISARLTNIQQPCKVMIEGAKSYTESKNAITNADILCVIDVDLPKNIHLPSKIADYVGARKPILYIGQPNAPVVRALDGHPAFAQAITPLEIAHGLKYLTGKCYDTSSSRYEIISAKFNLNTAYAALIKKIQKYEQLTS